MASSQIGFTAPKISALKCEKGRSQSIYWDSKTPSLGVRVTPSGKKAFIFQTWFNNTNLRMTIGDVNSWSIDKAQSEARRMKVLTDQGIDPREEKDELKQSIARKLKGIQGLEVWKDYIADRKD